LLINTVPNCQKYTPTDCFFVDLPTGIGPDTDVFMRIENNRKQLK